MPELCLSSSEFVCTDSPVVYAHWKLLNNVCKREGKDRWQHMAVKVSGSREWGMLGRERGMRLGGRAYWVGREGG